MNDVLSKYLENLKFYQKIFGDTDTIDNNNIPVNVMINIVEEILKNNSDPLDIKIHYHQDKYGDLLPLEKHGNFYDVRAAKSIDLKKDEHTLIPLGISIYLPDSYYATLLPRSSSFNKYGFLVANSTGIIDTEYRSLEDEWMLSVLPTRDLTIHKNDRIAQFTIMKEIKFEVEEGEWEAINRGGHGESGIK